MLAVQGSLVLLGANTTSPSVLWQGSPVPGVISIRVRWANNLQEVKLVVNTNSPVHGLMRSQGIKIKGPKHV